MGLLIGAAAIVIFVLVNMTGIVFGGEKLFIIDLIAVSYTHLTLPTKA